jgi:hypothetical protein
MRDGHDALKEAAPAPPWHLWQGASIAAAFAPPFRRVTSCRRPHGTAHVDAALSLATNRQDFRLHMTKFTPERRIVPKAAQARAEEDIRPTDIVMALGGCWVLLAVIAWLAMI